MIDLPGWLLVIPILAFLVFVHELGHFLTAKHFNIKVTEFGFGFPPKIWGFRRGETLYSVNLIPIGGFVKMVGEEDPTDERSFARQSVAVRSAVLLAGPLMNLIIPIIIYTLLLALPHDKIIGTVTVAGVAPQSPAKVAGMAPGDTILSVNGQMIENHADLVNEIQKHKEQPIEFAVRRSSGVPGITTSPEFSQVKSITLIPRASPPDLKIVQEVSDPKTEVSITEARSYNVNAAVGDTLKQGAVGILVGTTNQKIIKDRLSILTAIPSSFGKVKQVVTYTFSGIGGWLSGGKDPGLAGPIGIAQVTGEVAKVGMFPIFELTALISISLAIVNVLPIPALDGGRLTFVLIEGIRKGKRIPPHLEGKIHMTGFAVLIGLILLMSYFDIIRIISGDGFLP